jgi:hypothetical protein
MIHVLKCNVGMWRQMLKEWRRNQLFVYQGTDCEFRIGDQVYIYSFDQYVDDDCGLDSCPGNYRGTNRVRLPYTVTLVDNIELIVGRSSTLTLVPLGDPWPGVWRMRCGRTGELLPSWWPYKFPVLNDVTASSVLCTFEGRSMWNDDAIEAHLELCQPKSKHRVEFHVGESSNRCRAVMGVF